MHADMNGFFASVELLYRPDLVGKPVAVAGDVEKRHGVILAKNDVAKKWNVSTGEAIWAAKQRCPELVLLPPDYPKYLRFSHMTRDIFLDYTDNIEPFGLDEAWLDCTGSTGLFGDGRSIADAIRGRIKSELGITASIGVSYNKVLSKMGSDMKKPDATTVITESDIKSKVWPLPVRDLMFCGPATTKKLARVGVHTIGQLAGLDEALLAEWFGVNGSLIWHYAHGEDSSNVEIIPHDEAVKTIGHSTTTPRDLVTDNDVHLTMAMLSDSVATRLRSHRFMARTVQVYLRDSQMNTIDRQCKLSRPSQLSAEITAAALGLHRANRMDLPLRTVGVRACDLIPEGQTVQLSLDRDETRRQNAMILEREMDNLRGRFGHFSIARGSMMIDRKLTDLNPKEEHVNHPVGWRK